MKCKKVYGKKVESIDNFVSLVKLKRQPKQIIPLECGCTFKDKWTLCNEAKRLLKESQRDFKNRNEYDLHFKELKNK